MKQHETLSRNISVIENHLSNCGQCRAAMRNTSAVERIDAACMSDRQLDDAQVHSIILGG